MFSKIIYTITFLVLFIGINAQVCETKVITESTSYNQCNSDPWILVFEDNFNGTNLNTNVWWHGNSRLRYCNDEEQFYTQGSNIEFHSGIMSLIAKNETINSRVVSWLPDNHVLYCNGENRGINFRTFYYTSENVETIKKFTYGKFEARIKIPKGKGFWPAFWLYSGDPVYNEIDIFEFWNPDDLNDLAKVHYMNIHYDYGDDRKDCLSEYTGVDYSQSFHIFTLIWEKNRIEWYVDGVLKRSYPRLLNILGIEADCNINPGIYSENRIYPPDPMHIILNLAIQNENDAPDATTVFPNSLDIDWIRYYQRSPDNTIVVKDQSQYPLYNNTYNVISGTDVEIECAIGLPGAELEIIGRNSITFGPGFEINAGSDFETRFEQ